MFNLLKCITPESYMTSDPSWFDHAIPPDRALSIAVSAFVSMPPGWKALWKNTLKQLIAVRTPDREFSLNFLSAEYDNGVLELDMPWADDVLQGIARRCEVRSRFICRQCGQPGLLRQFDMLESVVLCARCAAPELLHRAIDDVLNYPGLICVSGIVDGVKQVPDVLRRSFARSSSGLRMNPDQFRNWSMDLEKLKPSLPPRQAFTQ